jgi:hypothetical protein
MVIATVEVWRAFSGQSINVRYGLALGIDPQRMKQHPPARIDELGRPRILEAK